MVIFDCNGVLVDSEPIASAVVADALTQAGVAMTAETAAQCFHGRRPADIIGTVEAAGKKLPADLMATMAAETLRRLRGELRAVAHVAHALTWLRGPKAVASSSPLDRIELSLTVTDLLRFFAPRLYSASEVLNGKPAPDLFRLAAARMQVDPAACIVVEDSAPGVIAALGAGMTPIGFVGANPAPGRLARELHAAGAGVVIADMRALKAAVTELRGF